MYFDSSFGRIYYEVHGSDSSPITVLFAHGVTMDHQTFDAQVAALKSSYRVVCPDLPGHGRSEAVDLKEAYSKRAAQALGELLDELGGDRVVLVGQSLGSTICQRVAAESPERVLGSIHLGGVSLYPAFSRLVRLLTPSIVISITLMPGKLLYAMFARHKALQPQTQAYLQEVATAAGKKFILRLTLDMLRDMTEGLPRRIEHPMLICHGDHEAGFLRRLASSWHEAQPESRLAVIENAHHIANQDNPSAFNGELLGFLEALEGSDLQAEGRSMAMEM